MSVKPPITFVLPGRKRSGGVCVTASMGNCLLARGYSVRIAYRTSPVVSLQSLRLAWHRLGRLGAAGRDDNGLADFHGSIDKFQDLSRLAFAPGEYVIAVGSMTVADVHRLTAPVVKIRYCHGFVPNNPLQDRAAWGFPMPTLAVSKALVARLEALSGQPVIGVVPNGIDLGQFHEEPGIPRDGIGIIYGDHFSKDPELIRAALGKIGERWPDLPRYVFGSEARPPALQAEVYRRFPSPDEIRRLYNRARIWLVASRSEGFSLPVLEAMACGAAVISTRTEGASTLIQDGQNGLLVDVGDLEALMAAIARLLGDEPLRRRLVEEGRRTVAQYSWAASADSLEACLTRAAEMTQGDQAQN